MFLIIRFKINKSNTSAGLGGEIIPVYYKFTTSKQCLILAGTTKKKKDLNYFLKRQVIYNLSGNLVSWAFVIKISWCSNFKKYKQYAEDINRINTFQQESGFIEKKEAPKPYHLFKLFWLKDWIFSDFMSRAKCPIPISTGKGKR